MTQLGCPLSAVTWLLFPALVVPFGWKIALPTTIVAFLLYFHFLEFILSLSPRYRRLKEIIPAAAAGRREPTLVFHLQRVTDT